MISVVIYSTRHNSVKNVDGVMVLVLCTSSDKCFIFVLILCKYLKGLGQIHLLGAYSTRVPLSRSV